MGDVLFHPEVQAEYDAAIAWYHERSPSAASRFEAEVERVLGLIDAHPEMFHIYDDQNRFAVLRRFPYSVVYQVEQGKVYVVAVAHGSRSPSYWHDRS